MLRAVAQRTNVLAQSAVPIGVPSSGSVAANGAITLTTALYNTYANIWLYFPAGALFAGSVAGQYFCQMSSTTLGTAYNIRLVSPTTPYVPTAAQLTAGAIVAAGPGAYVQTTTFVPMFDVVIPGGAIGPNGRFVYTWEWSYPNNVNSKQINTNFGGSGYTYNQTASALQRLTGQITNRGVQNQQYQSNISQDGSSGSFPSATISVNTAVAVTWAIGGTIAVATDFLVMESYLFQVFFNS